MLAEHRHQVARRVIAAAPLQQCAVAAGRLIEHGRAGVGQWRAVRREEGHRAHVGLFKGLGGDALEQIGIAVAHRRRDQRRQLLGDHFAALHQLALQVGLLRPGEIATQHQRHQAGRQQGQQQHATFDSQFLEHAYLPHPADLLTHACIQHATWAQCSDLLAGNLAENAARPSTRSSDRPSLCCPLSDNLE